MTQFRLDQVINLLVGGVVQGVALAGRCQESLYLFLCVGVKAGNVVGFVRLRAVEVLVVFRFISRHCVAPFVFAALDEAGQSGLGCLSLGALGHPAR